MAETSRRSRELKKQHPFILLTATKSGVNWVNVCASKGILGTKPRGGCDVSKGAANCSDRSREWAEARRGNRIEAFSRTLSTAGQLIYG